VSAPTPRPRNRNCAGQTSAAWYAEAEANLREAARRLEMLGLVNQEVARMALVAYRLAARVRSDRLAAA
jgi:hypothetical protein